MPLTLPISVYFDVPPNVVRLLEDIVTKLEKLQEMNAKLDAMTARIAEDVDHIKASGAEFTPEEQAVLDQMASKIDALDIDPNFPGNAPPEPQPEPAPV